MESKDLNIKVGTKEGLIKIITGFNPPLVLPLKKTVLFRFYYQSKGGRLRSKFTSWPEISKWEYGS